MSCAARPINPYPPDRIRRPPPSLRRSVCRSLMSNKMICRSLLGENDRQTAPAVMPDFPRALHRILPLRLPATNRRDAGCRPLVAAKTFCRPFLREFGRQRALSAIRGRQNALLATFTKIWPTTGVVRHPWPSKHFFAFRCVQKIGKHKNGCSTAAAGTDDLQHAPSRSVSKLCRSSVSNKIACRSFLGENDRQTAPSVMPDFPRAPPGDCPCACRQRTAAMPVVGHSWPLKHFVGHF